MEKKKTKLKWIIIVELIVFYFALLNVISHARGPVPYQIDTSQPVVQIEDFVPMAEMGVDKTETALPFYNAVEGAVAGYQSELQLGQLQGIHISFSVNCPADYAGNLLYIDLYNYEAGYDFPEQEYEVILQGDQQISFELSPGEKAPDSCFLRFFTNGLADYNLEQIQVNPVIALPRVTTAMIVAVVGSLLILVLTIVYYIWNERKKSNHEKGNF